MFLETSSFRRLRRWALLRRINWSILWQTFWPQLMSHPMAGTVKNLFFHINDYSCTYHTLTLQCHLMFFKGFLTSCSIIIEPPIFANGFCVQSTTFIKYNFFHQVLFLFLNSFFHLLRQFSLSFPRLYFTERDSVSRFLTASFLLVKHPTLAREESSIRVSRNFSTSQRFSRNWSVLDIENMGFIFFY